MTSFARPAATFVSYAHADNHWFLQFKAAVTELEAKRVLRLWSDHKLLAGDDWHPELLSRIDNSDIVILLVTPNFLASKFSMGQEVRRALDRHNARLGRLVPILIEDCSWKDALFAGVQGLPPGMKPVSAWPDEAFAIIASELEKTARSVPRSWPSADVRPVDLFTCEQLVRVMDGIRRTINVLELDVSGYPHGHVPTPRLIELANLRDRLQEYESAWQRRCTG
jgi:hypothetical protein